MAYFNPKTSQAMVIFLRGTGTESIVRHAFDNYKLEVVVEKFRRWILTKKYGEFINAQIKDRNGNVLLHYYNNGNTIELLVDNWNHIKK